MASQKGLEEQKSNNKPENENDAGPEKNSAQANQEEQAQLKAEKELMEAQEALTSAEEQAEKEKQARLKAEKELKEAQDALTSAEEQAKKEEQARLEAEKELKEVQKALTAAEKQAEKEKQAQQKAKKEQTKTQKELTEAKKDAATAKEESEAAKKALATAEAALAQAEKNLINEAEANEPAPSSKTEGSQDVVSFVVRVTYDTQGKPLLSNIGPSKDVKEGKELKRFQGLDGQGLVDYIENHIRSLVDPEASVPPEEELLLQPQDTQGLIKIQDVQVHNANGTEAKRSVFRSDEDLTIRILYEFNDPDALFKSAEEIQLKVQVQARELTSGSLSLLTTRKSKISKSETEKSIELPLRRLTPGLYRFLTTSRLQEPINEEYPDDGHGPGIKVIAAEFSPTIPDPQKEEILVW